MKVWSILVLLATLINGILTAILAYTSLQSSWFHYQMNYIGVTFNTRFREHFLLWFIIDDKPDIKCGFNKNGICMHQNRCAFEAHAYMNGERLCHHLPYQYM